MTQSKTYKKLIIIMVKRITTLLLITSVSACHIDYQTFDINEYNIGCWDREPCTDIETYIDWFACRNGVHPDDFGKSLLQELEEVVN